MPHPARFFPALAGFLLIGLMLISAEDPVRNLCRIARAPAWLYQHCLDLKPHSLSIAVAATALIALTLLLILQWQRSRPRAMSYESDAGRWIVLGWVLAIGGAVSLLAGMLLIGSNGWPFSEQSRHITVRTGQLPVFISTVQRRYFASYSGANGSESLCASFGVVTIENRSRARQCLDLDLVLTPRSGARAAPPATMPTREDLAAIARRGLSLQAMFSNPVELQPRERARRELVFVFRDTKTLSDRDYAFALAVRDRESRRAVSFALPAEYHG